MSRKPGFEIAALADDLLVIVDELGEAAETAMFRAAVRGKARAVEAIGEVAGSPLSRARFNPVDTGEMRRSYVVRRIAGGAVLENVAPHAAHQEHGTRPFTPPIRPLERWAERKLRGSMRAGRGRAKQARAMARAVRRAIQKRGIIPKSFHTAASQDFGRFTEEELLRELRKVR